MSTWLRNEREFSFYGDVDFIPTEQYRLADAERAMADALFVLDCAGRLIQQDVEVGGGRIDRRY